MTVGKLSRLVRNLPDCPKKLSRLSRNFSNWLETFQIVQKLSRLSGNPPDCSETFQTSTIFCFDFELILWICAKTFRTRKNFPVGNADASTGFFWLWSVYQILEEILSSRFYPKTWPCQSLSEWKCYNFETIVWRHSGGRCVEPLTLLPRAVSWRKTLTGGGAVIDYTSVKCSDIWHWLTNICLALTGRYGWSQSQINFSVCLLKLMAKCKRRVAWFGWVLVTCGGDATYLKVQFIEPKTLRLTWKRPRKKI